MEIKLKDIAVAMGAPMKPNPKGLGPHTMQQQLIQPYVEKEVDKTRSVPKR